MSHIKICTFCGRKDVPNWDGQGHCISCTRDILLGKPIDSIRLPKPITFIDETGFVDTNLLPDLPKAVPGKLEFQSSPKLTKRKGI